MDKMRHLPERLACLCQQRIADLALAEIADKRHRELRPRRSSDRGGDAFRADIGEHCAYALADQRCVERGRIGAGEDEDDEEDDDQDEPRPELQP